MIFVKLLLLLASFSFDRPAEVKRADGTPTYESPADYRTVVCASGRKVKWCRP